MVENKTGMDTSGWQLIGFCRDTIHWTQERLFNKTTQPCIDSGHLKIINGDLNHDISGLCEGVDVVINFAAKTFVDHSIRDPEPFVKSNVLGTHKLIEESRKQGVRTFIQISTDEVYGTIDEGFFDEESPIKPRNPYAASKAAADALVMAYSSTYGMKTCITRTENNYGPLQHPQKAIPVFIGKMLKREPIPIYGDGLHVRQWLYVEDHVWALLFLIKHLADNTIKSGEVFHIAGNEEVTNKDLVYHVSKAMGIEGQAMRFQHIDEETVRPGHDRRYAISSDKIRSSTKWRAEVGLTDGLKSTVEWYKNNINWIRGV
tara:strand:+ start:1465 stop:2415 length:951 start_codon:yes stop_codon:yes gene_type:complete